jgi:tetratricopeptide (TPR) repeat protein
VRLRDLLPLAVLVSAIPWTQARIDRTAGTYRTQEEVLYLWSGEHVKRLFPGFEALAADVYWLRTVQYFGGERLFSREKRFELLRPLVDITTTLDPRLEIAYRYGAIFLSEAPPVGAGRPREGMEVLARGVRHLPHSWRLRQDYGFFCYLYLGDTEKAAAILNDAAEMEGAAFWLRMLAADLLTKGGSLADARRMWQQMYDQAEEGIIRQNAKVRLEILDSLELARRLAAAVAEFERRSGRRPARLEELRAAGLWRGPVTDTEGVRFGYDRDTGRVVIARESPLWRPEPPNGGRPR